MWFRLAMKLVRLLDKYRAPVSSGFTTDGKVAAGRTKVWLTHPSFIFQYTIPAVNETSLQTTKQHTLAYTNHIFERAQG
jgi:hypothetical protein